MKYWKRMKKSTKIGLATSAVYAATALALPAFAAAPFGLSSGEIESEKIPVKEEKSAVIQPIDLSQITTVEQAGDLYNKKLQEYWVYKDYNSEAVENLRDILVKKRELVNVKDWALIHKRVDLADEWAELVQKIEVMEKTVEVLELAHGAHGETASGEFINLEGIKTSKEAEDLYLKKFVEYHPYDLQEARNLHKILLKQKYLLNEEFSLRHKEHGEVDEQESALDKKIHALEKKLVVLKAGDDMAFSEGINLGHIKTVEQANILFDGGLAAYCMDKKLDPKEIRILHRILVKERELSDKVGFAEEVYFKAKRETKIIVKKRSKLEKELENLKGPNEKFFNYLSEQRKKIEVEVEKKYPSILNKRNSDINVSYPSDVEPLACNLTRLIQQTAKEIYTEISLTYNDDDSCLENVSNTTSDNITLRDVAKVLRVISVYESMLGGSQDDFLVRTEILKKEINALNLQEKKLWQKALDGREKSEVEAYVKVKSDLTARLKNFSNYIAFKDRADDFIKKFDDRNKYWGFSVLTNDELKTKMGDNYTLLNKSDKKLIENNLNQYLKTLNLDVAVASLKNPTEYKFPIWFCILVNGFTLPIARNILLKKYMDKNADSDAYLLTTLLGIANGGIGVLFLDGLHPLVFPARMLTPFVIQPIKAIMDRKKG